MRTEQFAESMNYIDDQLLAEADSKRQELGASKDERQSASGWKILKGSRRTWIRGLSAAACLAIILLGSKAALQNNSKSTSASYESAAVAEDSMEAPAEEAEYAMEEEAEALYDKADENGSSVYDSNLAGTASEETRDESVLDVVTVSILVSEVYDDITAQEPWLTAIITEADDQGIFREGDTVQILVDAEYTDVEKLCQKIRPEEGDRLIIQFQHAEEVDGEMYIFAVDLEIPE